MHFYIHVQMLSISGNALETVFNHVDRLKILLCSSDLGSSQVVHLVQTTGETSRSALLPLFIDLLCDGTHVVL